MQERVQKIIAASGYCSRRKAEELIELGKVTVNGVKITIGDKADKETDTIRIGKQEIKIAEHLYLMLHKPSGFLTTKSDLWDRKSIMELIDDVSRPVYPVGRLDRDARGLLLLTSDGDFAQQILHPSKKTTKTYQAIIDKPLHRGVFEQISKGVRVEGRGVKAHLRKIKPKLVELTLHEGRNKIVKKYFNELGYYVTDLKRVAVGTLRLNVPEGKWRNLTEEEKEALLHPKEKVIKKKTPKKISKKKSEIVRKS